MVDITHKSNTLRKAVAEAVIRLSQPDTAAAVRDNRVPKGNVFEFSRAAGLLAVKKTADVIPDCHPLPVEFCAVRHRLEGMEIIVEVEVHTIYKTGVEVEAMHGAAVTALTIYDMLKPIDKGVEIAGIRLLEKKGGKTDRSRKDYSSLKCATVVCSDTVSAGGAQDTSGKAVIEKLKEYGLQTAFYTVIPDEFDQIQDILKQCRDEEFRLLLFVGGTGLSPRDKTPEAVQPLLDREIPGLMEAARQYGMQRTPYAMLSRGVAGFAGNCLVLTLPGSVKGAIETVEALFPHILHVFEAADGRRHENIT